jgi:hypothetical protein
VLQAEPPPVPVLHGAQAATRRGHGQSTQDARSDPGTEAVDEDLKAALA